MKTQIAAKWITRIVWGLALCAFIFSWFHAPFDNDPIQLESVMIFISSMAVAITVHLLCLIMTGVANNNWRLTTPRVLALLVIVPLVAFAILKFAGAALFLWETISNATP